MAIPDDPQGQVRGYYANQVLYWANAMKGRPYKWGGNGPNEFDCSGFVHFCFASADVPGSGGPKAMFTRMWTTYNMILMGDPVPVGQEQPGDLCFPNTGHVGICTGNGQMIDAPQDGIPIGIHKYGSLIAVRRLVNPTTQAAADNLAKNKGLPIDPSGKRPSNLDPSQAIPTSPLDPLGLVTDQLAQLFNTLGTVSKVAEWLANPKNWLRIGQFAGGAVALILGMVTVIGADKVARTAQTVTKVVK